MKRARSSSTSSSSSNPRRTKRLKTKNSTEEADNSAVSSSSSTTSSLLSGPPSAPTPTTPAPAPPPEEEPQCGICYENIEVQGLLDSCKHLFCFDCAFTWSKKSNTCPLCKARFHSLSKVEKKGKGGAKVKEVLKVKKRDASFSDEEDYLPTEEDFLEDSIANFIFRFFPQVPREDEDDDSEEEEEEEEYQVNFLFQQQPIHSFYPHAIPIFLNYGPRRPVVQRNQPPVVIDLTQDSDTEDEKEEQDPSGYRSTTPEYTFPPCPILPSPSPDVFSSPFSPYRWPPAPPACPLPLPSFIHPSSMTSPSPGPVPLSRTSTTSTSSVSDLSSHRTVPSSPSSFPCPILPLPTPRLSAPHMWWPGPTPSSSTLANVPAPFLFPPPLVFLPTAPSPFGPPSFFHPPAHMSSRSASPRRR